MFWQTSEHPEHIINAASVAAFIGMERSFGVVFVNGGLPALQKWRVDAVNWVFPDRRLSGYVPRLSSDRGWRKGDSQLPRPGLLKAAFEQVS